MIEETDLEKSFPAVGSSTQTMDDLVLNRTHFIVVVPSQLLHGRDSPATQTPESTLPKCKIAAHILMLATHWLKYPFTRYQCCETPSKLPFILTWQQRMQPTGSEGHDCPQTHSGQTGLGSNCAVKTTHTN